MEKIIIIIASLISFVSAIETVKTDSLFMRSEYDTVGYSIGFVVGGTAIEGADAHYYEINSSTGEITVAQEIIDNFGIVTTHYLTVTTDQGDITVTVVDGLDYLVSQHKGRVITEHQTGALSDTLGNWASYNNLWGDGTAIPNQDYRVVILIDDSMPNNSSIIWDTPGLATDFGGSSVWNYTNFMFGGRKNQREVVDGFPFCIDRLEELKINFDYTPIIGDDQFKVALNMFLTDTNEIAPMNQNRGDFFVILDQKGNWIPKYDTTVVEDTTILGEQFTLLYDTLTQNGGEYERRRVIVKDGGRVKQGEIDILSFFDRFSRDGMLNKSQYIPNIQFGVEVTSGFGAIEVHSLSITKTVKNSTPITMSLVPQLSAVKIEQRASILQFTNTENFKTVSIFSLNGRELFSQNISGVSTVHLSCAHLSAGSYIVQISGATNFVQKIFIK